MRVVDIGNKFISIGWLNFRKVRWWKRLFNEHIDLVIFNYLYLYNKSGHLNITQKTFRLDLVKAIMIKDHPLNFVTNTKINNL